jgi:hypothetical protein
VDVTPWYVNAAKFFVVFGSFLISLSASFVPDLDLSGLSVFLPYRDDGNTLCGIILM